MAGVSVIVCTRNRAEHLGRAFERMRGLQLDGVELEMIVVDNGSTDQTSSLINEFADQVRWPVVHCVEPQPGLGRARNCGIIAASADLFVFTDDDCFFCEDYFQRLSTCFCVQTYGYGGGQILPVNPEDDERVAILHLERPDIIAPFSYCLKPGRIQGANLIFRRDVFDAVGLFREDMGAGTPFPCEDIEMACRASNAGYAGILIPELKVFHDHRRLRDSPEALRVIASYAQARGAYYASLIREGRIDALGIWMQKYADLEVLNKHYLVMLAREMRAAADFIDSQPIDDSLTLPVSRHLLP